MSEVVEKIVTRAERLRDLGFTEIEIADVSEAGLDVIYTRLRQELHNEQLRRARGSELHLTVRENWLTMAVQIERTMRGMRVDGNGPVSVFAKPLDKFNHEVGRLVVRARSRAGHSADWLAHALSCSHRHIEEIERGQVGATTTELAKIAIACGITLLDLVPAEMHSRLRRPAPASPEHAGQSLHTEGETHHSTTA